MSRASFVIVLAVALVGSSTARAVPAACPAGQVTSADTHGHCCWPDQAWSQTRDACVGAPTCPGGFQVTGEACVAASSCPAGQAVTVDTAGHCCWVGQAWSQARQACVGAPQSCPAGAMPSGDNCVLVAASPPPTYAPPPVAPVYPAQPAYAQPGYTQTAYPQPTYPAPALAPPGTSTVRFQPFRNGAMYNVTTQGQSCTTPCSLNLAPGALALEATGSGRIRANVSLPAGPATVRLQHFTVRELVASSVIIGIGLSMVGGGVGLGQAYGWDYHYVPAIVGLATAAVGGVALLSGTIGLAAIRGQKVEVTAGSN